MQIMKIWLRIQLLHYKIRGISILSFHFQISPLERKIAFIRNSINSIFS